MVRKLLGKPKICYFDIGFLCVLSWCIEDVLRLKISMKYPISMNVVQAKQRLIDYGFYHFLTQAAL
jgi:hypothetical protein